MSPQLSKEKKKSGLFSEQNRFDALHDIDREETKMVHSPSPSLGFSNLTVQQVIEKALKSSSKLKFSKNKGGSRGVGESSKGRGIPIPFLSS